MRIGGLLLLAVGAALCLSIDWATIGFLAMALGLICVQIPTRRAPRSDAASGAIGGALISVEHVKATPEHGSARAVAMEGESRRKELTSNDLLDRDADLADVEHLLSHYGAIYVDQFRRLYCIFNSKALLPSILALIVEAARHQAGMNENIRDKSPDSREPKFVDAAASQLQGSIAVSDPASTSSLLRSPTENASRGDAEFASRFEGLSGKDEPMERTKDWKAAVDSEDLASFTSIFDQLNQSSK